MNKHTILRDKFGYTDFRPGQEEVIDAVLEGRDVLALMPTGAGKSICYQIPALLLEGLTIVISPLISLMKDQVTALRESGCKAAYLNSSQSAGEYTGTIDEIQSGGVKLLYIAPERLQKTVISHFTAEIKLPLIVVDEAHCISQWGHDFRTSYLQIAEFINGLKPRPVAAAFTATATVKVREDIRSLLALKNPFMINTGFDRPNLFFEVQKPKDKKTALLEALNRRKNLSGIIYCATRKTVEDTCDFLVQRGFDATRYHAGLTDNERRKNQEDFIYDRKTIMTATNAFGMGIDKSNVSFVIHYNMPKNIESYYQEAGRAGRDGAPADCILFYSGQDVRINQYLITHGDEDGYADKKLQAHNALAEHNLELLKQMTFFATLDDCLRRRLLAYFGEQSQINCGNCSNCLAEHTEIDVTEEAQKIISCVYRLKQRGRCYGKTMITDILRGSKNEKIRSLGFDTLSTYGLMTDMDAHRIRLLIDFLVEKNCLFIEESEYPVVTLGSAAGDALKEERRFFMKLPKERKNREHGAAGSDFFRGTPNTDQETENKKTADAKQNKKTMPAPEVDAGLFEKLRKLRKDIASRESVPAYIVFSDASLRDMSVKKPVSLNQFSAVNGVGNIKLEKYGGIFTDFIREHLFN